ncbi:MAG: hypothetical protein E7441_10575 [Ruminococcaceae bacterium]|nr:hypothetical protein [Oscillospiraceae bacterium]
MSNITIDFSKKVGKIKPMHAVNNGPTRPSKLFPENSNFDAYKAANIPYARNHDAAFCSNYGGEHTVDINAIFWDFEKDPYDPASYDFACTDEYIERTLSAGTKIYYRLGNKIDHRIKKYDSRVPSDFKKWAVICEHIIMHYNEGWADGFHHNIEHWEIWNEPDLGDQCWLGTPEEFMELFKTAAVHLKTRFPHLKIGGPAMTGEGVFEWLDDFLPYMKKNNVPIDFYSWHAYRSDPHGFDPFIMRARELLDKHGYTETEQYMNEWNYISDWGKGYKDSINTIAGMKGAAFTAATMAFCQNRPIDMLMYYDARPGTTFNGLFSSYKSDNKLKGYYPFPMFDKLYKIGTQIEAETDDYDIYPVAASDGDKTAVMITYFSDKNDAEAKSICIELNNCSGNELDMILLDGEHDAEKIKTVDISAGKLQLSIEPNTVIMLESK